ncbi:hypothetical protein [Synechococcus lacustris]|uniref:Uncharacterized protein n=1 Tax=Synechococcus lacustris str. Tous TaxID=1910958 RepID=A0A2P7EF42_9SYNE|nr:hypothetical protein [Synechococcus lacustris]PSI01857.1 hypothetical protein C7K08_05565 [Synechococcus lacustris str. Tous]
MPSSIGAKSIATTAVFLEALDSLGLISKLTLVLPISNFAGLSVNVGLIEARAIFGTESRLPELARITGLISLPSVVIYSIGVDSDKDNLNVNGFIDLPS